MSFPAPTQRMTRPLLLIAASVTCLAFALWGAPRGVAAAVGAGLSVLNWFSLRWLVSRMFDGGDSALARGETARFGKAALGMLLMAKIGALIALVFVLINRVQLDPIGLAFGLGVLFVGPALAGLLANTPGSLNHSAAAPAREER